MVKGSEKRVKEYEEGKIKAIGEQVFREIRNKL